MQSDDALFPAADEAPAVQVEEHHVHGAEVARDGPDFLLIHQVRQVHLEPALLRVCSLNGRNAYQYNGVNSIMV